MENYSGDDIVISGIDGRYPKSKNVEELGWNLYNKIDMVTEDETRWSQADYPFLPKRKYIVDGLEKFDATMFKINPKQADLMDPQCRILIELAYSTILDAGIHPSTLRGSRTGVFTANTSDSAVSDDPNPMDSSQSTGSGAAFLSNRISYALDLKGPSLTLDTGCSASLYAILMAVNAIRLNQCDAALVCSANVMLNVNKLVHLKKLGVLSPDGQSRSFDNSCNGYVPADAISTIFLQKRQHAKRIYADIVHVLGNNDGYKSIGIVSPSGIVQSQLFSRLYDEAKVDPLNVTYVEGHITGTVVGDLQECLAIDTAFNKDRIEPLLVGSIKPNMGHGEASSALCSIAKIIHAFQTCIIPATIHIKNLRTDIPSLIEGRLRVCTDHTILPGPLVAVNSTGIGGSNGHILLRQWNKPKNHKHDHQMPRLVVWSGRTEKAVSTVIDKVKSIPFDPEFLALLHQIQKVQIPENVYRGFGIFEDRGVAQPSACLSERIVFSEDGYRSVAWIFTGMGCQWIGMGKSLMQIRPFYESIQKCHRILKKFAVDLISIITTDDPHVYDKILCSCVGITCIQIALVDVLRHIEISPDYILGHSNGELVAAYTDGAMTLEQTVLSAYYKGKLLNEENTHDGLMAAVGMGYEQIKDQLPPNITVGCHNSAGTCTITGLRRDVIEFGEKLRSENVFVNDVQTSGIAYHSKYIEKMATQLLKHFRDIMPERALRSPKWISTSISCDRWESDFAKYSSAEYHINNFKYPVLFEEACLHLPKNAIIIEISPHGLLQAIMKRSFVNAINVPLAQKDNPNNAAFFLEALGTLFINGVHMQIDTLYPQIEFPVSRGTPMIAPLIKYDHDENWSIPNSNLRKNKSFERKITIDISREQYQYLTGHKIDDRYIISSMTYCYFVWETLAMLSSQSNISDFDVEFTNIRFHRATSLDPDSPVHLSILIHLSGNFEVIDDRTLIVTGTIKHNRNPKPISKPSTQSSDKKTIILNRDEIYRELQLQGYKCSKLFRGLDSFCVDDNSGGIQWQGYWDAFMDAIIQTLLMSRNIRETQVPTAIHKIKINAVEHSNWVASVKNPQMKLCSVSYCKETNTIVSGGIEISGVATMAIDRRQPTDTEVLEDYQFVPLMDENRTYSLTDAVRICVQLAIEQSLPKHVSILEALGDNREPIIEHFRDVMLITPIVNGTFRLITDRNLQLDSIEIKQPKAMNQTKNTIVICNTPNNDATLLAKQVSSHGFLIIVQHNQDASSFEPPDGFIQVSAVKCANLSLLVLHRHDSNIPAHKVISIDSEDHEFSWLKKVQDSHKTDDAILLVEQNKATGLLGLWKTVRLEPSSARYTCVIIDDEDAPLFSVTSPFYCSQLKLGLPLNILQSGKWGTYRHLTLKPSESITYNSLCIKANSLDSWGSLEWTPSIKAAPEGEMIQVKYFGLSRRDMMIATRRLSQNTRVEQTIEQSGILGREFSGIDANGQHVMGMKMDNGALATRIASCLSDFVFTIPNSLTLEEAASIPYAYLTVYSAFFIGNEIRSGQTILIHDGCNYMALAAIQIALVYGLDVYTTVSSRKEKEFLLHRYSALKEANIRIPEKHSIGTETLRGFKMDVVLSFQPEDQMEESIQCLKDDGMMIAVEPFNTDKVYQSSVFLLKTIYLEKMAMKPSIRKHLVEMINADLQLGVIIPLPLKTFHSNEIASALHFTSTGKQNRKIVIAMPNQNEISKIRVKPRFVANPKSVYVVAGGLGGLGLEMVHWMIMRGAKILILCSRRGLSSAYQRYRVRFWETLGCKIICSTSDITSLDGCKQLLNESLSYGPVVGIFNLAGDPFGCIISNQTPELFKECFAAKVHATKYLNELSRSLCPELEYFVVFSSVASGRGSAGQAAYSMANSIMDQIAEIRAKQNLPGKSIQFGPICDGGMLSRMIHNNDTLNFIGLSQQRMDRWLHIFDDMLFSKNPIIACMQVAQESNAEESNVFVEVLQAFGVKDVNKLRASATLADLGIDSLVVTEVKQILEREISLILSVEDIKTLTVGGLKKLTA